MVKPTSNNLAKIINILNDGEYHDGNSIGKYLKLTRSAVWKIIKKLQHYGIKIESTKGKGYILLEPLKLLDEVSIKNSLITPVDVHVFETIHSTNTFLKQFKHTKIPNICIAEQQTQGKGRFNREWYSPFGKNIYLSCLYPFQKDMSELAGLSLMTSLAVVKTLSELGVKEKLCVKWANDVVYEDKKLAGNLIEIQAEAHAGCQAIIGIGLNVNMLDSLENISQGWTSLQLILNKYIDRTIICSLLINNLLSYLKKFEEFGFNFFLGEWEKLDFLSGKTISLNIFNEKVVGKVIGINEMGYLLLQLDNGEIRVCSSGDASLVREV